MDRHSPSAFTGLRARRKPLAGGVGRILLASAGALAAQPLWWAPAVAGPQGGQVVAGQASIQRPDAASTVIHQQSHSAAINWRSFDVAGHETVRFQQPSASSAILNRVLGQSATQIHGAIEANGRVFIMNARGVVFGPGARVEVGALHAGSLEIRDEDFMAGRYRLAARDGETPGAVINRGLIRASTGGSVTLVGGQVSNEGTIVADLGHVHLAAGRKAVLDFDGDGLIRFEVDGELLENVNGAEDAVRNTGEIRADGGRVTLSAHAAREVFSRAVNNEGVVSAARIERQGGRVTLSGSGGSVRNSGTVDVSAGTAADDGGSIRIASTVGIEHSGRLSADATGGGLGGSIRLESAGETRLAGSSVVSARSGAGAGGRVEITGDTVALADHSRIDVSGASGGGTALVGGDWQGRGELPNARHTTMAATASIDASARNQGDGGTVVVWADETAKVDGSGNIRARGGEAGGDGGRIETSGKRWLRIGGAADASAPMGRGGVWLLDPIDVTIQSGVGFDVSGGFADDQTSIDADTIVTALSAGTSVEIRTDGDPLGADAGDITVVDGLHAMNLATPGATLTLVADRDVLIQAASGGISTIGASFNLVLEADRDVDIGAAIATGGGSFTSIGTGFTSAVAATLTTAGGAVSIDYSGAVAAAGAISSAGVGTGDGGNVTVRSGAAALAVASIDASGGGTGDTAGGEIALNQALADTGIITLGGDLASTGSGTGAGGALSLGADVVLDAPVGLATAGATGGNLTVSGELSGPHDLSLNLGSGTATFEGLVSNLGTGTGPALSVQAGSTGLVRFQGAVGANSGLSAAAGTSLRFDEDVTLADGDTGTTLAGGVELSGLTFSGFDGLTFGSLSLSGGPVTLNSNGGAIGIGTLAGGGQNLVLAGGIGAGTVTVTGAVSNLGTGTGAALSVQTGSTGLVRFQGTVGANSGLSAAAGTSLRFDEDVTLANGDTGTALAGDVELGAISFSGHDGLSFGDTVLVGGGSTAIVSNGSTVGFAGTLDGSAAFAESLVLTAGAGDIRFQGPVGGAAPLGELRVVSARHVDVDAGLSANALVQEAGTGTTTFGGAGGGGVAVLRGQGVTDAVNLSTDTITFNDSLTAQAGNLRFAVANNRDITITTAGMVGAGATVVNRDVAASAGSIFMTLGGSGRVRLQDARGGGSPTAPVDGLNTRLVAGSGGEVTANRSIVTGDALDDATFPQVLAGTLSQNLDGDIFLGDDSDALPTLTDAQMDGFLVGADAVRITTTGGIVLDRDTIANGAFGGDLRLEAVTFIRDNTAAGGFSGDGLAFLTAGTLILQAGGAIGGDPTHGPLDIDVGILNVVAAGGPVVIDDPGLGDTRVDLVTGGAAPVTFTKTAGDLLVERVVTTGDVRLALTGGAIRDFDPGDPTVNVSGDHVELAAAAIGLAGGALRVHAATRLVADTSVAGGDQFLSAPGAAPLGLLDAGTGNITLTAGGSVTDVDADPTAANVVADTLRILGGADIGVSAVDRLDTRVGRLELQAGATFLANDGNLQVLASALTGGVDLAVDGSLALHHLDAGANPATLTATGALTDATPTDDTGANALNLTASDATLTAASVGGAGTADLDVSLSGRLAVDTTTGPGNVFIATPGGLELGLVTAGLTADVTLEVPGNLTGAAGTNVLARRLTLLGGGTVASAGDPLATELAELALSTGAAALVNTGALDILDSTATGTLSLTGNAGFALAHLSAPGSTVTLTPGGVLTSLNPAGSPNITAGTLRILGNTPVDGVDVAAANLQLVTAQATLRGLGALRLLDSTVTGALDLRSAGTLTLDALAAAGQTVALIAEVGSIVDGNGAANNVTADDITLRGAISVGSTAEPIETTSTTALTLQGGAGGTVAVRESNLIDTAAITLAGAGVGRSVDLTLTGGDVQVAGALGSTADALTLRAPNGFIRGAGLLSASALTLEAAGGSLGEDAQSLRTNVVGALRAIASAGGIFLQETVGGFTVNGVQAASGPVRLQAAGAVAQAAGGAAAISHGAGSGLELLGPGAAWTLGNPANAVSLLAGNTGAVTLATAGALEIGELGGSVGLATGGGPATLSTGGGDLRLSRPLNAGGAGVSLAASGAILDRAGADTAVDVVAGLVTLNAGGRIGESIVDALNLSAGTLVVGSAGGPVFITDESGGLALGAVNVGANLLHLRANGGGGITSAGSPLTSSGLVLEALNGGSIGTLASPIRTANAGTFTLRAPAGDIAIREAGALATSRLVALQTGAGARTARIGADGTITVDANTAGLLQAGNLLRLEGPDLIWAADLAGLGVSVSLLAPSIAMATTRNASLGTGSLVLGGALTGGSGASLSVNAARTTLNGNLTLDAGTALALSGAVDVVARTDIRTARLSLGGPVRSLGGAALNLLPRTSGADLVLGGPGSFLGPAELAALGGFGGPLGIGGDATASTLTPAGPELPGNVFVDGRLDVGPGGSITLVALGDIVFRRGGQLRTGPEGTVRLVALGDDGPAVNLPRGTVEQTVTGFFGNVLDQSSGAPPAADQFIDAGNLVIAAAGLVGSNDSALGGGLNVRVPGQVDVQAGLDVQDAFVDNVGFGRAGDGSASEALAEAWRVALEDLGFGGSFRTQRVTLQGGLAIEGLETTGLGEFGFIDEGLFLEFDVFAVPSLALLPPAFQDADFPGDLRPDDPDDDEAWEEFIERVLREYVRRRYEAPDDATLEERARAEERIEAELAMLVAYYERVRERERAMFAARQELLDQLPPPSELLPGLELLPAPGEARPPPAAPAEPAPLPPLDIEPLPPLDIQPLSRATHPPRGPDPAVAGRLASGPMPADGLAVTGRAWADGGIGVEAGWWGGPASPWSAVVRLARVPAGA